MPPCKLNAFSWSLWVNIDDPAMLVFNILARNECSVGPVTRSRADYEYDLDASDGANTP